MNSKDPYHDRMIVKQKMPGFLSHCKGYPLVPFSLRLYNKNVSVFKI